MKTDREFIGSVYNKIAEYNKNYTMPSKSNPAAGILSVTAAAVCIFFAVILIPGLIHPALKDGTATAMTEAEAAETEKVPSYRFEGLSPDELCTAYDLKYDVYYPDYYIQTDDLNSGERIPVAGVGLKIAALSEWTFGNTFDTKINTDHLLYKLTPVMISLTEKSDTLRTINDLLGMISGSEPDIITERMEKSTVYYCVKYPDGPPTGELSDAELEAFYNQVIAYFFCEHESGYLLRFLLLSTKENIDTDVTRCLAMLSTAEITEGDPYHFNIDLPLDAYTLAMSSVPGLPFTINTGAGSDADFHITASRGTVITWGAEDNYEVKPFAGGAEYDKPVTLYWSPLEDDQIVPEEKDGEETPIWITVTVTTPDMREGKRVISITGDGIYYYAHVSAFSYSG